MDGSTDTDPVPTHGRGRPPLPARTRRYEVTGPGRGRVAETPIAAPAAGQALVRVRANGLCASELPRWANQQRSYPIALGHEPVGEVVAAGDGVDLAAGDRVTGRIVASFADHVLADAADLVAVPEGVATDAALGEPLGCVAEGLRRTPVALADRVAVVGLGFMGLCMLQLLARTPQAGLVALDLRADARGVAAGLGAEALHPDAVDDRGDLRAGFDVVVEATGAQAGLDVATALVRPHGTLSILGYHQGARTIDMRAWNHKALTVVNAHVRDRALLRDATRRGLAMVAAGHVDLEALITHRFALDELDRAFATLQERPDGFVKAVVVTAPDR